MLGQQAPESIFQTNNSGKQVTALMKHNTQNNEVLGKYREKAP